jgi:hypothetical protein
MDDRLPRNCLAQFLPTNEFHSPEIRRSVTSRQGSNTVALPKTRKRRAPKTALLRFCFRGFSLRLDARTRDCIRGEFHIESNYVSDPDGEFADFVPSVEQYLPRPHCGELRDAQHIGSLEMREFGCREA